MRTFKHFPEDSVCKICGRNDDKECILVPIDGTDEGWISEAIPIHVECLEKIRYNKEAEIFYIKSYDDKGGSCGGRKQEKQETEKGQKDIKEN